MNYSEGFAPLPLVWSADMRTKLAITGVSRAWHRVGVEFLYKSVVIRQIGQLPAFVYALETREGLSALVRHFAISCFRPPGYHAMHDAEIKKVFALCANVVDFAYTSKLPSLPRPVDRPNLILPSTITRLEFGPFTDYDAILPLLVQLSPTLRTLSLALPTAYSDDHPRLVFARLESLRLEFGEVGSLFPETYREAGAAEVLAEGATDHGHGGGNPSGSGLFLEALEEDSETGALSPTRLSSLRWYNIPVYKSVDAMSGSVCRVMPNMIGGFKTPKTHYLGPATPKPEPAEALEMRRIELRAPHPEARACLAPLLTHFLRSEARHDLLVCSPSCTEPLTRILVILTTGMMLHVRVRLTDPTQRSATVVGMGYGPEDERRTSAHNNKYYHSISLRFRCATELDRTLPQPDPTFLRPLALRCAYQAPKINAIAMPCPIRSTPAPEQLDGTARSAPRWVSVVSIGIVHLRNE
ncbi:hypothetical protein B0H15DRAFT_943634 [Mycena belliarum]|uniref:Uncharacterized protein n=1 Tax=Mycena belliarum TaxID=1033014 RepID=A0AAD6UFB7_9AGAR|nr:hypothetical protein B0H15DRAFT_943634 [Mycena belliae]